MRTILYGCLETSPVYLVSIDYLFQEVSAHWFPVPVLVRFPLVNAHGVSEGLRLADQETFHLGRS